MIAIVQNRKAAFNYAIESRIEAGIQLLGWEVKAIRAKRVSLVDSYVEIRGKQAYTYGMSIQALPFADKTGSNTAPARSRKLLLHRNQIDKIYGHITKKGMVCIITQIYIKNQLVKLEIGLGKGKKLYDKRQDQKDKDWKRQKDKLTKYL